MPLQAQRTLWKSHFILRFPRGCQRNGSKNKELISPRPSLFLEYCGIRHHLVRRLTALPSNHLVGFISQEEVQSNSEIFLLQIKFNLSHKHLKTQCTASTRTKLRHLDSLCLLTKLFHVSEIRRISESHTYISTSFYTTVRILIAVGFLTAR